MPLTRAKKTEKISHLAADLEKSTSAIVGTFAGLTASKDFELRKTVRAAGGSYHVVKNKLAARAAEGTKIEEALKGLKGVSSVAYTSGDPVALAKALSTWVKDNAEFTFKLGIIDGKVIDVREIGELATMPGKEELFSKLLFLINSPAQRLATVINATGRDLAVVINQGVEKGKFAGPAAVAAPVAEAPAAVAEAPAAVAETPAAPAVEAPAAEAVAHVEESAAGEQPSGAAQPENATASQGGEAATTDPVEG
jgi:large subunit ribosomal protein L10